VRRFGLDRLNALSDGIFAIAITLLALAIDIPSDESGHLWAALRDAAPQIVGYVISFGTVAVLWLNHHRLFDDIEAIDVRLIQLNLTYLGLVAFLPFPSRLLGDYGGETAAVVVFAVTVAATVAVAWLMQAHARRAGLFKPDAVELVSRHAMIVPAVFLASVPIAFVSPKVAMYSWLLLVPLARWEARREQVGAR
jgi:TMEM175 potassium channel family protein